MILKIRTKSIPHRIYEQLYCRTLLSAADKRTYWNQVKGWEGELEFDTYLERLHPDCLIINDLRIKKNNTDHQIDSVVIVGDTIYVYEVKKILWRLYVQGRHI